MLSSGPKSYYDDYSRKKGSSRIIHDPPSLLTDRGAYVNFLEVQLERVSAACLGVQSYDQRFNDLQQNIISVEEKLASTTRLVGLAQQYTEEMKFETDNKFSLLTKQFQRDHNTIITILNEISPKLEGLEKNLIDHKYEYQSNKKETQQLLKDIHTNIECIQDVQTNTSKSLEAILAKLSVHEKDIIENKHTLTNSLLKLELNIKENVEEIRKEIMNDMKHVQSEMNALDADIKGLFKRQREAIREEIDSTVQSIQETNEKLESFHCEYDSNMVCFDEKIKFNEAYFESFKTSVNPIIKGLEGQVDDIRKQGLELMKKQLSSDKKKQMNIKALVKKSVKQLLLEEGILRSKTDNSSSSSSEYRSSVFSEISDSDEDALMHSKKPSKEAFRHQRHKYKRHSSRHKNHTSHPDEQDYASDSINEPVASESYGGGKKKSRSSRERQKQKQKQRIRQPSSPEVFYALSSSEESETEADRDATQPIQRPQEVKVNDVKSRKLSPTRTDSGAVKSRVSSTAAPTTVAAALEEKKPTSPKRAKMTVEIPKAPDEPDAARSEPPVDVKDVLAAFLQVYQLDQQNINQRLDSMMGSSLLASSARPTQDFVPLSPRPSSPAADRLSKAYSSPARIQTIHHSLQSGSFLMSQDQGRFSGSSSVSEAASGGRLNRNTGNYSSPTCSSRSAVYSSPSSSQLEGRPLHLFNNSTDSVSSRRLVAPEQQSFDTDRYVSFIKQSQGSRTLKRSSSGRYLSPYFARAPSWKSGSAELNKPFSGGPALSSPPRSSRLRDQPVKPKIEPYKKGKEKSKVSADKKLVRGEQEIKYLSDEWLSHLPKAKADSLDDDNISITSTSTTTTANSNNSSPGRASTLRRLGGRATVSHLVGAAALLRK